MPFEIIPNFITEEYEHELIDKCLSSLLESHVEVGTPARLDRSRLIRYGYAYDALSKRPPIPNWLVNLCSYVQENGFNRPFNAITINEYPSGHGIAHHVDSGVFDDVIIVLSLGSACTFQLKKDEDVKNFTIEPRSLSILSGEERYLWTHSVLSSLSTGTRYSIVLRTHTIAKLIESLK